MKRVLLCKPYPCLCILYVRGDSVSRYINEHLPVIEEEVSDYIVSMLGITPQKLASINTNAVVANFYPDKRKRQLKKKAMLWNTELEINVSPQARQGALLGLFTPFNNANYKLIQTGNESLRKIISFRKKDIQELIRILSKGILKNFEITLYGEEGNGETETNAKSDQLGLF